MTNLPVLAPKTLPANLNDQSLATLAATSPVAAYVRTLSTDTGRRSTAAALALAAELLTPAGVIPPSKGKGRNGNAAERFAAACRVPFHALKTERLGELRAELIRKNLAPASINKVLSALRGVLHECWKHGLFSLEEAQRGKECLKAVRGSTLPKGRHLKRADLARLFVACRNDTPAGARDAAVLALLAVGLRRAEVAAVQMGDYDPASGRLVVKGKGNKERAVWLTNGAKEAVGDWLAFRGTAEGALLARFDKSGKMVGLGMTDQAVYGVLARLATDARVAVAPHDLRRTFAGDALDAGVDVSTLQTLMGHASPATTARYDRRPDEVRQRAMALLTIPYNRK